MGDVATDQAVAARHWWQRRGVAIGLVLLAAVPLLWPAVPPLTDLLGHIGRYRILLDAGAGPLALHYAIDWRLIGNLGVDGLVLLLAPLLGLEPATKLVVIAIPMLTVAALLWLSREVHGRVQAGALFALPLAYAAPLQWGFVNFALGSALALAGLALWIRLSKRVSAVARAALFVPIAGLVWLCHAFAWALLGLAVLGAEWAIRRGRGDRPVRAGVTAAAMAVPMLLPVAAMTLLGGAASSGPTGRWFDLPLKLYWIAALFRERWVSLDLIAVGVPLTLLLFAWRSPRLRFVPVLGVPALLGAGAFLALPMFYAGASLVDARMVPFTLALALLAIRVRPGEAGLARGLALIGAVWFAVRLAISTVAFALLARDQAAVARTAEALPVGAAVLVLVNEPAVADWRNPRLSHVGGLAVARRRVFSNDQWALAGQQLVRPLHPTAAPYDRDPSQLVYPPSVMGATRLATALRDFDRGTFGYVWTIGFPRAATDRPDLVPVRADPGSTLYRVRPRR